ncbi:DUF58 domain-containing protein [Nocardioides sp. Root140]|uniref:DUF58 domain-containing protein n=1 Tax=Nocardioides sp. Root140 TaxID=1736460 RepID=UPI0006F865AA|nr:DUF58 domain-containing protein [Nocardioides sp. Root140]KQY64046.1 hypothetical protein ASD30_03505 [Nocardioides sp. Root140]
MTPRDIAARATKLLVATWRLFTREGRAVVVLALGSMWLGNRYHWNEMLVMGLVCLLALAVGLVTVLWPRRARADLTLHPAKVVVGSPVEVQLSLHAKYLPLVHPVIEVPLGRGSTMTRLGLVAPGRSATEDLAVPTDRRGVHRVGPVTHLAGDVLGLFRRRRVCSDPKDLFVRPVTIALPTLTPGVVVDLEGVPSDQLSASDLAFHALREYVPGDDLRHVHWRSSAKQSASGSSLLVRQYQETRRSHATVIVDSDEQSYDTRADFELAVSVGASLALRAAYDDFEVAFACGDTYTVTTRGEQLLDASCHFAPRAEELDLPHRVLKVANAAGGTSFVAVVSGGRRDAAPLSTALSAFPHDAHRLVLMTSAGADSRIQVRGDLRAAVLGDLKHLPALLWRLR